MRRNEECISISEIAELPYIEGTESTVYKSLCEGKDQRPVVFTILRVNETSSDNVDVFADNVEKAWWANDTGCHNYILIILVDSSQKIHVAKGQLIPTVSC